MPRGSKKTLEDIIRSESGLDLTVRHLKTASQEDLAILAHARVLGGTLTSIATEFGRDEEEIEALLRQHGMTPNRGESAPPVAASAANGHQAIAPHKTPTMSFEEATAKGRAIWNADGIDERIAAAEASDHPLDRRNAAIARQALAGATNAQLVETSGLSYSSIVTICQRFGVTAPRPERSFEERSQAVRRGMGQQNSNPSEPAAKQTDWEQDRQKADAEKKDPDREPLPPRLRTRESSLPLLTVLGKLLDRLNALTPTTCDTSLFALLSVVLTDLTPFSPTERAAILGHLAKAKGVDWSPPPSAS